MVKVTSYKVLFFSEFLLFDNFLLTRIHTDNESRTSGIISQHFHWKWLFPWTPRDHLGSNGFTFSAEPIELVLQDAVENWWEKSLVKKYQMAIGEKIFQTGNLK